MLRLARILATAGGIGYLPRAPGTAGSVVGLLLGVLWVWRQSPLARAGIILVGALIGVAASTRAEREMQRHDPSCIVIDEIIGMLAVTVALPAVTQSLRLLVLAFGLFRLFDILKPPPLRWLSRFPGGWGIMLDDLGAGGYTVLVLWMVMRTTVFVHSP